MDERFALAGKGLYYLFLSVILFVVGLVTVMVPLLGWIAGPILMLVGLVLQLMGPYVARDAHPNFQNAFFISLGILVVSVVSVFLPDEGFLAWLADIITDVLSFLAVYFICTAAGELLAEKGDAEQAARAELLWKVTGLCAVISILCTLTSWIPVLGAIVGVAGVVSSLVGFVAYILEIIFYYKASQSLKGA